MHTLLYYIDPFLKLKFNMEGEEQCYDDIHKTWKEGESRKNATHLFISIFYATIMCQALC